MFPNTFYALQCRDSYLQGNCFKFCCCQFPHARSGNTALCETNRQWCILWLSISAMCYNGIQWNIIQSILLDHLLLGNVNFESILQFCTDASFLNLTLLVRRVFCRIDKPSLFYHLFGPPFMNSSQKSNVFEATPSLCWILRIVENNWGILGLNSWNILYTCNKDAHFETEHLLNS